MQFVLGTEKHCSFGVDEQETFRGSGVTTTTGFWVVTTCSPPVHISFLIFLQFETETDGAAAITLIPDDPPCECE